MKNKISSQLTFIIINSRIYNSMIGFIMNIMNIMNMMNIMNIMNMMNMMNMSKKSNLLIVNVN